MVMDISGISYFLPAFSFTLVLVVVYAVLNKTGVIGGSKAIQAVVAIVLSLIFISLADVRIFVEKVTPWFGVLVIAMFFIIFFAYFGLKEPDKFMKPWIIFVFIGLLVIVFLVQGYHTFDVAGNPDYLSVKDWLYDEKVAGTLWLVLFAAVAVFAVTRKMT